MNILAFGFTSPLILWGLALAALPIIIHLLHKRRYRETEWAAMRFLLDAARKNSRRIRLEQLILLGVRVLLLVLLVVGLAQPLLESYATLPEVEAPRHRIIVVDTSFSMGYVDGGQSRFARATHIARDIAQASRQGDALNLLRICQSQPPAVVRQPSFRPDQVVDEINQLPVSEEPGHLLATLEDVLPLLNELPEIPDKEVFFISDLQRESWLPGEPPRRAQIRTLLESIASKARLSIINAGEGESANAAVTAFTTDEPFASVGREIPLNVTVANFSRRALPSRTVTLLINGQTAATQTVDVDPNGTALVPFRITVPSGGMHRLEARLQEDQLPLDDVRRMALRAEEQLNVLLVNGKPAGRAADNATYYVAMALAPSTPRQAWNGGTRATVISDGELAAQDLSRFDCVVLCNVALFTQQEAAVLQTYVEAGGGLIVCLGDQVRAENYNLQLYRDEAGVLPARLDNRRDHAAADEGFPFDLADLKHAIVNVFDGNPGTGLDSTLTYSYIQAIVDSKSTARIALRYATGDPAIVEKAVGQGRAILVTTSADVEWGTLPILQSFPPLVHEMVLFALTGRTQRQQLLVGQPLLHTFPAGGSQRGVKLTRPDGGVESVVANASTGRAAIVAAATEQSGFYEAAPVDGNAPPEIFAVNVDPRESNLETIAEEQLQTELLPATAFQLRSDFEDMSRKPARASSDGSLTTALLAAALALLFVELLMAWRFTYGLTLLGLLTALAAGRITWDWYPGLRTGLAILALVLIAGVVGAIWVRQRGTYDRLPRWLRPR